MKVADKFVFMHGDDEKTEGWGRALKGCGYECVVLGRRPMLFPVKILTAMLKAKGRPAGCYYRYLNDKRSIWGSIALTFSYLTSIIILRAFSVPIFWVCHNINRETHCYHPRLSEWNRRLFMRASQAVYVVDPLMMRHFKTRYPSFSDKCKSVTFGYARKVLPAANDHNYIADRIREFLSDVEREQVLVGLCCGQPAEKVKHFDQAISMLDTAEESGFNVRLIIIGPLDQHPDAIRWQLDDRVLYISGYRLFDEARLSNWIDFFWRSLADISISYTIYVAASVGKPILTLDAGFLAEAVKEYGLGAVLDEEMSKIRQCLSSLCEWQRINAEKFLQTHQWSTAARVLVTDLD